MSNLVGIVRSIVQAELEGLRLGEIAVVEPNGLHPHSASSDKDNYSCDVRLKNSGLVLKQVPVATGHIGTAAIPNEGDLVLLTFGHGDPNQPIITGRLYNDEDRPPLNKADEVILRLPLAAPDSDTVKLQVRNFQDQNPPRELLVEMAPKIEMRLKDQSVVARAGNSKVTLNQPGARDGQVVVEAGGTTITMDQDGDVSIAAMGNVRLSTNTGDVSIEGNNVSISSRMGTKVEAGSSLTMQSKMGATVDGGLSTTVKGATVSIKGLTSFSP